MPPMYFPATPAIVIVSFVAVSFAAFFKSFVMAFVSLLACLFLCFLCRIASKFAFAISSSPPNVVHVHGFCANR